MSPASDQPARLIVEVRQFNLQPPFRSCRPFAEDLEDEAGAVDDLALGLFLQRLLLDRAQGRIDDEQFRFMAFGQFCNLFDLAFAEQACRADLAKLEALAADDVDPDRPGKARRFLDPGVERAQGALPGSFRYDNKGTVAARYAAIVSTIENAQPSSSWLSPARFSGCPGCIVEMACL